MSIQPPSMPSNNQPPIPRITNPGATSGAPLPPKININSPTIPGMSFGKVKPRFNQEDFTKASVLPVVVASSALVVSVFVWILNRHSSILLSLIGYLLCPFAVIVCLGLDNFNQRVKTSQGQLFIPNQKFGQVLRVMTGFGLLLSYPHISGLADHISAWLAQIFPWMAS
jgi:hypothetical protein